MMVKRVYCLADVGLNLVQVEDTISFSDPIDQSYQVLEYVPKFLLEYIIAFNTLITSAVLS